MTLFIGVDVGAGGGIAAVTADGRVHRALKMPDTDLDVVHALEQLRDDSQGDCRAMLEKVHSSPQMGVASAFSFGGSYRGVRMALAATRIRFEEITPQAWQRRMQCLTGGDKNVTRFRAQQLFPDVKCTHAISDALLLAECLRRLERGAVPA